MIIHTEFLLLLSRSGAVEVALEHKDVGLGLVDHVVTPSEGLLDAQLAPLGLLHQAVAGDVAGVLAGQDDVAVLGGIVEVLLAVHDLVLHAAEELLGLLLGSGVGDAEEVDVRLAGRHIYCMCMRWWYGSSGNSN